MANHPNRRKSYPKSPVWDLICGDDPIPLSVWIGGLIDWIKADIGLPSNVEKLFCKSDVDANGWHYCAHTGGRVYPVHPAFKTDQDEAFLRAHGYSAVRDHTRNMWFDERRLATAYDVAWRLSPSYSAAGQAMWSPVDGFNHGFLLGLVLSNVTLMDAEIELRPFTYPGDVCVGE
jgi:hypothetical protein